MQQPDSIILPAAPTCHRPCLPGSLSFAFAPSNADTRLLLPAPAGAPDANEVLNERAVAVMKRMSDKLTGRDFAPSDSMPGSAEPDSVHQQVQRLIQQATSDENLCQSYIG